MHGRNDVARDVGFEGGFEEGFARANGVNDGLLRGDCGFDELGIAGVSLEDASAMQRL